MTNSKDPSQATNQLLPEEFLKYFPGAFIQYFDDSDKKDKTKSKSTASFNAEEATRKQRSGCGVYFSPNAFKGERKIGCLTAIQSVFADIDCAKEGDGATSEEITSRKSVVLQKLQGFSMKPHAVIETKNGLQAIWMTEPANGSKNLLLFREIEELLITYFDADKGAKDPARVLRLPGFLHQKDPKNPFCCILLFNELDRSPYELEEVATRLKAIRPITKEKTATKKPADIGSGVSEGGRNSAAASMTGQLLSQMAQDLWEPAAWPALKAWNTLNSPPLPDSELRSVFDSIIRKALSEKEEGKSLTQRTIEYIVEQAEEMFHDQFEEPYARIKAGHGKQTLSMKSKDFEHFIRDKMYSEKGVALTSNVLHAVIGTLASLAVRRGRQVQLETRVIRDGKDILYDMGDGTALRISANGCAEEADHPIGFRRHKGQLRQAKPESGGRIDDVFQVVSMPEPEQQLLYKVTLVTWLVPDIANAVICFYGKDGTAKTCSARFTRHLVDPSEIEDLSFPHDLRELMQQLSHCYCAVYDNVAPLTEEQSNQLCRAVTGSADLKRSLYTNDDDFLRKFRRRVMLTAINFPISKGDLLSRTLRFPCAVPERRMKESALIERFTEMRPRIFGAILDALSKAIKIVDDIQIEDASRLADFEHWGCAVAIALGHTKEEFIAALRANMKGHFTAAVRSDPVGRVVEVAANELGRIKKKPLQMYEFLSGVAQRMGIDEPECGWPANAQALTNRIGRLKANLEKIGVRIATGKSGERWILIEKIHPEAN